MVVKKISYRIVLAVVFLVLGIASVVYSNMIVGRFAHEEKQKMEIWADATRLLLSDTQTYSDFALRIVERNVSIPVVIVDNKGRYISSRNFKDLETQHQRKKLTKKLKKMGQEHPPIEIKLVGAPSQYIYYQDSILMQMLKYFPYVQFLIVLVFFIFAYWFISTESRMDQNKVWVGLTKETAHQLGTPISSLAAWQELLKISYPDDPTVVELEKDVNRLSMVVERFSKNGKIPKIEPNKIVEVVRHSMAYMEGRASCKVFFSTSAEEENTPVMLNVPLFEWVIENLCKNAIDAIQAEGQISVEILKADDQVIIDFSDTGKGIDRTKWQRIFSPGFTTKKRGWGLGLSLAKRIVSEYHGGQIFVKSSELNKGTTFRILLKVSPL